MSHTRTFIAVGVDSVASSIDRIAGELRRQDRSCVRWVSRENYHVNLAFLGDLDAARVTAVCRVAADTAASSPPFRWRLAGLGAFPNLARANVLWVGVSDPTGGLGRLHESLESKLSAIGFAAESRRYRPHVTIGRVKRGARLPMELAAEIEKSGGWVGGEVETSEIVVFGSELRPVGPRYSVLAKCPLGGVPPNSSMGPTE